MANLTAKRIINGERGLILSKVIIPARDAMIVNGRPLEAKEETYLATIVSSPEFDPDNGYVNGVTMNYEIDKAIYDKIKYGDVVSCKYEFSQYGTKPISFELVSPAKPTAVAK